MKKHTLREYIKSQIHKTLNEDVRSQWGTMTYDERLDTLLPAIKDPDEADHWANTEEFTNLPPQVQSIFDHPEDDKDIVKYKGEDHEIMKRDGDKIYIRRKDPAAILGKLDAFWVKQDDLEEGTCGYKYDAVTGRKRKNTPGGLEEELDEISALESYVKEAIKEYMKGTPWSHGIAVGHRINKYNDPELIRKRYDKAAEGGFKGRPKGRLSNPRGYSLNESKDCNCGCDDYEKTFLREYIQKYIAPKIT